MQVIIANSLRHTLLLSQLCIAAIYSSTAWSGIAPSVSSSEHQLMVGKAAVTTNNEKISRAAQPEYPALPAQSLVVNEQFQMLLRTVDNNGLKVGIVSVDLPDGAEFTDGRNNTRVLSWLPQNHQIGEHRISIVVFNAEEINTRQRIELILTVLDSKPDATLDLPKFATPGDQTEIKLIPAAALELVIPNSDNSLSGDSLSDHSERVISTKPGSDLVQGSHLLPTYLTDPTYKVGESR